MNVAVVVGEGDEKKANYQPPTPLFVAIGIGRQYYYVFSHPPGEPRNAVGRGPHPAHARHSQ